MERSVLHVDCNKFYASVECLYRPDIRNKPVAVGGDEKKRCGIILTKNEIASKYGLTVGEPLWKARAKCPQLVIVPPNFPLYHRFSRLARQIYEDYSDYVEPFGLDECWIDVTGCEKSAVDIAQEIRRRVKDELGITVSIGVSFNKIFAKIGSDYKKPDAVTVIDRDNYKNVVWTLPVSDLLMAGRSTCAELNSYGISTIGELAEADSEFLKKILGKNGETLKIYANGGDISPVMHKDETRTLKSVGNSITAPRDLVSSEDVKSVFRVLCENVSRRLRQNGLKGRHVCISVKDSSLSSFTRQCTIGVHTDISTEILSCAMKLFSKVGDDFGPVRALGVSVSDFDCDFGEQFDFYKTVEDREKQEKIERTVDCLRSRFGNYCIQRASQLKHTDISYFTPHGAFATGEDADFDI